jgi:HD-GYP domain-containing protein (c-di-GMP phosphodiesterase class II)
MDQTVNITEISGPPNLYPGFVNVALRSLVPGTRAPCPIRLEAWASHLQRLRLVIAKEAGALIEAAWRDHLLQEGVTHAFIALEDLDVFQDYLSRHTHVLLAQGSQDPRQDPRQGHSLVYELALCSMKSAMLDPRNGRRLGMGVTTVRQVMDMIWDDERTRSGLLRVLTGDKQLYTHSLNVTLLGAGFARAQGWPREQAENLAVALFFHDLGLMDSRPGDIADDALCQSRQESTLREHPLASQRFLSKVPGLALETLETVLNHHENLDGSGYPRGLTAPDLPPLSRLARIVDTYESSTSGCGAVEAVSPFAALRRMRDLMAAQLDQRMLEDFVRFIGHI